MLDPIQLSTNQAFEVERLSRAIDGTTDTEQLQGLAKQLLKAWQMQRAATTWVMQHQFQTPLAVVEPEAIWASELLSQQPDIGADA